MALNKYRRKINLALQCYYLKKSFPDTTTELKNNTLIWYGEIKPTPLSRTYNIKLEYKKGFKPRVYLYGEHIIGIEKKNFPHHYEIKDNGKQVELCLYIPFEFNDSMIIADTIILWAQEWLFYYEIWILTNEWHGGGRHPAVKKPHRRK